MHRIGHHAQITACTPLPGQEDKILSEFLHDYEDLADGNGLTEKQKVETILCYVPCSLRDLWKTLPGYYPADWHRFWKELNRLNPDTMAHTRFTHWALAEFTALSAEHHIRSENDVLKYYWNFLTIALPLVGANKLTQDDFNTEFFKGFHKEDQDILTEQIIFNLNPCHPQNKPFQNQDVLQAAREHFASDTYHKLPPRCIHQDLRSRSKTCRGDPEKLIEQLFGERYSPKPVACDNNSDSKPEDDSMPAASKHPTYKTRNVHFKEPSSVKSQAQPEDEDDPVALITKLTKLSIHEPSYFVLFMQCQKKFLDFVQHIPKPECFAPQTPSGTATVAYQSPSTPTHQPWAQHMPAASTSSAATPANKKAAFFRKNSVWTAGCAFCGMLRHRIHSCPAAEEYVDTGHVKIVNSRLHLPTGQLILNDGCGHDTRCW